jgi:hypothetical protein
VYERSSVHDLVDELRGRDVEVNVVDVRRRVAAEPGSK